MSKQTLYKYFDDLEELGVVKISRKIGKANLYKINLDNPMVRMLTEYTTELSLQEMEKQAKAPSCQMIISWPPSLYEISLPSSNLSDVHQKPGR